MGKLSLFLKSPFEVDVAAEWTDVAAKLFNLSKPSLQMEIIDLQEDVSLQIYKTVSTEEFWVKHVPVKYENCKKLAINLATMFGSTYSIITHWFEKGSEVTYVDISYNNNELIKSVHEMKYVSVISRTTKKKVLYQNEGYMITAKNLRVFKDEFMFLLMEEGWKPDVYFLIVFKEIELSEINDVLKILLHYHVFKVLVINGASNADVYTYNPFENYGCGKVFTRTISYGKCAKANITKSFFLKPVTGLKNCTFEVGFYNLPPYVINPNKDQRKEKLIGIDQYVLQTLSELEQFKVIYTYKFNPGEFSGIGDDMRASGPLSFIQKGDIEIMIGGYHLMHKRSEAFGYLYGHHSENDGLIIVVKKAGLVSNFKNTYIEFNAVVWTLLGVAFILFFVVFVKIFDIRDKCGTILVMWNVFFQHGFKHWVIS
ncbi:unnamed protein product [Parnassius apollo]|uniref:(apollo) hypothetical protein n=1 Tax=Parnassius apollo TaxID=110799 RepID=A0A8S3XJ92_PARAO|nr:unnamed protein product [Parnassius apollo]